MSSLKFSGLLSDAVGKLGGSTISRNKYGRYIKNWRTPINPQSVRQQAVRNTLKNAAQRWQLITEVQRTNWSDFANKLTWYNRFGDPYKPGGFEVFCQCNFNRYMCTAAFEDACPAHALAVIPDAVTAYADLAFIEVTTDPVKEWPLLDVLLYASPCLSPARNYCRSDYRFIKHIDPSGGAVYDVSDEYLAVFPAPVAGQRIFFKFMAFDMTNYLTQIPLITSTIVEDP